MSLIQLPKTEEMLALLGDMEAAEIRSAGEWKAELMDMAENGDQITGEPMPWSKTHDKLLLRSGEVTIWGGMSGHFKSAMTGMIALWLARHSRVCIMSLEMKPKATLDRMAGQAAGCQHGAEWAGRFADWADNRIFVYDQTDTTPADRILGAVYWAAKKLNCKHVFIDSLAKCGTRNDAQVEQEFIDRLGWAAKTLDIHIHLICHVRKPDKAGEEYVPNKFDVRGASQLTDLVDNVVIWWKNKARIEAVDKQRSGGVLSDTELNMIDKSSDFLMIVAKQRHAPFEGKISFYRHSKSMQFTGDRLDRALPFNLESQ